LQKLYEERYENPHMYSYRKWYEKYYQSIIGEIAGRDLVGIDRAVTILNILLVAQVHLAKEDLVAAYYFSQYSIAGYGEYKTMKQPDVFDDAQRIFWPILRMRCDERNRSTISIVHPTAREFLNATAHDFDD
ncbi:hypothetical protein GP486_003545, partial [Trichoglossum hirsutum]